MDTMESVNLSFSLVVIGSGDRRLQPRTVGQRSRPIPNATNGGSEPIHETGIGVANLRGI